MLLSHIVPSIKQSSSQPVNISTYKRANLSMFDTMTQWSHCQPICCIPSCLLTIMLACVHINHTSIFVMISSYHSTVVSYRRMIIVSYCQSTRWYVWLYLHTVMLFVSHILTFSYCPAIMSLHSLCSICPYHHISILSYYQMLIVSHHRVIISSNYCIHILSGNQITTLSYYHIVAVAYYQFIRLSYYHLIISLYQHVIIIP